MVSSSSDVWYEITRYNPIKNYFTVFILKIKKVVMEIIVGQQTIKIAAYKLRSRFQKENSCHAYMLHVIPVVV
ncbi:hypothetical protein V1478_009861 [Vespula squamosa]|uniref:Uncharacterized protein n=1 Tax=Vespula squamosa TaxID=30214 RepID=A0ABD2AMC8_VESSQ